MLNIVLLILSDMYTFFWGGGAKSKVPLYPHFGGYVLLAKIKIQVLRYRYTGRD